MPRPAEAAKSASEAKKLLFPATPKPFLFNALKHHLLYLRQVIRQVPATAPGEQLRQLLLPIGAAQLDFYTAKLSVADICTEIKEILKMHACLDINPYKEWVASTQDYKLIRLSDASEWVLRTGHQPGCWVHLHPARYSPHSLRLKANTLKTAVALLIRHAAGASEACSDLATVNWERKQLALPPLSTRQQKEAALPAVVLLLLPA